MAETGAAAREIAKATGTAFGDDAIGDIMTKYDKDGNGVFDIAEVRLIVHDVMNLKLKNNRLHKMVAVLVVVVFLLIGALIGTSIVGAVVGGERIKESKVPDCDDPLFKGTARCAQGNLVRTGQVESYYPTIFYLATGKTEQLANLKDVTFYVDMTADASVGGAVEATFKVAGAYKRDDKTVHVVTNNGYKITLDSTSQSGSIVMNGATYPVLDTPPAGGRRLETAADVPILETVSGRELAERHTERRKLFQDALVTQGTDRRKLFQGALMTSGSFTMMAASGGDFRRKLFHGALMTSGSFTMMAAGGGDM